MSALGAHRCVPAFVTHALPRYCTDLLCRGGPACPPWAHIGASLHSLPMRYRTMVLTFLCRGGPACPPWAHIGASLYSLPMRYRAMVLTFLCRDGPACPPWAHTSVRPYNPNVYRSGVLSPLFFAAGAPWAAAAASMSEFTSPPISIASPLK